MFEEYAIRDVDSTQAIALKLAPLVQADELAHQSAGIINDVTGRVTGTQAERMHNGSLRGQRHRKGAATKLRYYLRKGGC